MPKPKNKYDQKHLRNLDYYQRQIDEIYKQAVQEAVAIGKSIDNVDTSVPFAFDDYPLTKRRVSQMLSDLNQSMQVCIVNGVQSEWTLANNKNNALADMVFGKNKGKLSQAEYRRYYSTNESARDAFLTRKVNGLSLSDRVWKYTDMFKDEIEMGLDLGIRGGLPATEMARDLKQYLQHPSMLFRRVRDEHGNLHLSQRAKAFHPGRGVYRSSYMNARRTAATECNMAYRSSDYERWQQQDFVVGIEIHLSNNHTCKGRDGKPHPFEDICDELQGRYPKDFKFTGWHPHCRCFATSILKTDEETRKDTEKLLRGEKPDNESVNKVRDVPENYKKWVEKNQERIANAKSLPYFLKDNPQYGGVPNMGTEAISVFESHESTPLEIAQQRHANRTQAEIDAIKSQWNERVAVRRYGDRLLRYMDGISDVDTSALRDAMNSGNNELILREANSLKSIGKKILALEKLDNPMAVARATSMSEAVKIHDNVVRTLKGMSTDLDRRKSKLEFEIDWMSSEGKSRYPETYKYAQDAYKKELASVQRKIDVKAVADSVDDALAFATTTRSVKFKALADEMRTMLSKPDTNIDAMRQKAQEVNDKYNQLNQSRKRRGIITADDIKAKLGGNCPKTIENLQKEIDYKEKRQGWTQDERDKFRDKMLELFENSDYGMNVPLYSKDGDDVVEQIFKSYFKAQQETGTGKGMVDIATRKRASNELFGTDINKASASDYEKYGFLMDKDILKQAKSGIASQYWSYGEGIQIRFNKNKVIATFTTEDSLGSGLKPSLTTDPRSTSCSNYNKNNVLSATNKSAVDFTHQMSGGYVELQYHGNLGLDCIESIYIPKKVLPKIKADTLKTMKGLKCKIYTDDGQGNLLELK